MRTRGQVLHELGLGPEWVQRNPASAIEPLALAAAEPAVGATEAGVGGADLASRADAILQMDWAQLKAAVAGCTACALARTRNRTVFGGGDEAGAWMFVGEGPGADEDARGEPFVGPAGRLLDSMLASIALTRDADVYIANIVKCRPPGNRNPEPGEAGCCRPYLQRQVELLRPRLIVALGKVAAVNLLGRDTTISALRGQVHSYRGVPFILTYHPAYLLRNPADKAKAWEDLCFAVETMRGLTAQAC